MLKNLDVRLKKQSDFNLVFNKGKKIYSKSITIVYIKSNELKFGISLSKKHGNAVLRNRIKRLLRASFRNFVKNIKGSYYFVLMPKVNDFYSYNVFVRDLEDVLNREKLLND